MIRKVSSFPSPVFKREKPLSPSAVSVAVIVYFFGALGVHEIDPGFLLMAWMMAGLMMVTVYYTVIGKGSFLNPYTMFFAVTVLLCLMGYFVS